MEGSDSEDDDFSASVSDLDGSEQSTDGNTSDGGVNDKDEDAEGDEDEGEDDAEGSVDDLKEEEEEEEEEFDPTHHPLLRPGAMPKMSKAALEMAVGIVENDLVGGSAQGRDGPEEEEEDELLW